MIFNRITLEQGTSEWHEFRRGKISASKVPIILGLSPYCSPLQLYEEEMGLREPQATSPHMQRGLDVEDQVRDWFFKTYGIEVFPCVLQSKENPLFIASLDGINSINTCIVEIKNNNKEYHEMAKSGKLCAHHVAQVQFQMFVAGFFDCWYISYNQGDYALVVVKRDQAFIDEMIPKLLDFKRRLDEFDPPEPTDKDYVDLSHDATLEAAMRAYKHSLEALKQAEIDVNLLKHTVLERIGNRSAKGTNWKVTRHNRQGNVDYDAILLQYKVDANLEQFRKKGSYSYRITVQ
jgi:putative phage-type endonuclease